MLNYRSTLVSLIKPFVSNVFSETTNSDPTLPYVVIHETNAPRDYTSSGVFEYVEADVTLFIGDRAQGESIRESIIHALEADTTFAILCSPSGVDTDSSGQGVFIFAVSLSIYER